MGFFSALVFNYIYMCGCADKFPFRSFINSLYPKRRIQWYLGTTTEQQYNTGTTVYQWYDDIMMVQQYNNVRAVWWYNDSTMTVWCLYNSTTTVRQYANGMTSPFSPKKYCPTRPEVTDWPWRAPASLVRGPVLAVARGGGPRRRAAKRLELLKFII